MRRTWLLPLAWLLVIYALLPVAPALMRWLRGYTGASGLRVLVAVGLAASLVAVLAWLRPSRSAARGIAIRLLPLAVLTLLITVVIGQPQRVWHIPEYALLFVLIQRALPVHWSASMRAGVAMSLTVHAGCLDEIIQHYLPMRVFDPTDIAMDALGGLCGLALWDAAQRCRIEST